MFDALFVDVNPKCNKGLFTAWITNPLLNGFNSGPGAPSNGSAKFSWGPGEYCTGDARRSVGRQLDGKPRHHRSGVQLCKRREHEVLAVDGPVRLRQRGRAQSGSAVKTTFELMAPDLTRQRPYGQPSRLCEPQTFPGYADISKAYAADPTLPGLAGLDSTICPGGATAARGPLRAPSVDRRRARRARTTSRSKPRTTGRRSPRSLPAKRMPIFTNEDALQGEFYLARVLPSTVDRVLRVQLFDVADFIGGGSVDVGSAPVHDAATAARLAEPGAVRTSSADCQYTAPAGESGPPDQAVGAAMRRSGGPWYRGARSTCSFVGAVGELQRPVGHDRHPDPEGRTPANVGIADHAGY